MTIPPLGANLPTGQVQFRVTVQGPGPRSPFYKEFFSAIKNTRPTIAV